MPTEIVQLLGFDGPNLRGPQPGVFLKLRADKDRSRRLKNALKDGAQSAGMVMGYLEIDSLAEGDSYIISATFTTPTPAIGVELARYVVEGLNAKEAGDEEWDAEVPLWELQKRRRADRDVVRRERAARCLRSHGIEGPAPHAVTELHLAVVPEHRRDAACGRLGGDLECR